MEKRSVLPNNKLTKTKHLQEKEEFREYIPETIAESKVNLEAYLTRYRTVYVKPNNGTGGRGVIRVKIAKDGGYVYQLGTKKHEFRTFDGMYKALGQITSLKPHLVQKGIPLLKAKGRPFDIRVMVQRGDDGKWLHTGTIARIARPKLIVTNYHRGGTPIELEKLLGPYLSEKEIPNFVKKINELSVKIAEHLGVGYPYVTAVGVDIGLDRALKPWIIEVNTKPDPYIFKKLKNKRVFKQIIRYIRLNRIKPSESLVSIPKKEGEEVK
ncbi:YheC/YheD family protein [Gorillibacterium timonense]|uniref:YheC/YheD family protein n=1 Tax=Gorillibacterium timonense TaxID=1689269 RepID=UPI00071CCDAD|nr:YheC/YheD family protein [Gorillibacterium timonense]